MATPWGTLLPHGPGQEPVELRSSVVTIGSAPAESSGDLQHVRVPGNKFLSRSHFELRRTAEGEVLVVARSRTNLSFLNGCVLPYDQSRHAVLDADNAPHQPAGCTAPDAPILFACVPNRRAALSRHAHADEYTGFSLIIPAIDAPPPSAEPSPSAYPSAAAPPAAAPAAASSSTELVPLPDRSRNGWVGRNKDKWQCQQQVPRQAPATNLFLADELEKLGEAYKAVGGKNSENSWKHFQHTKQAKALRALDFEVTSAAQLRGVRGFGDKTIQKIDQMLKTGELQRLKMMQSSERHQSIMALSKVHGVGPTTAAEWFARGITTVDQAVASGVMSAQQRVGARHWEDLQERIPREEVSEIVDAVRDAMRLALAASGVPAERIESAAEARGVGSYRRGKPSSGDVDVLITRFDGGPDSKLIAAVLSQLKEMGCSVDHLTHEEEVAYGGLNRATRTASCHSYRGIIKLPARERFRRLDIKVYPMAEYAYALLYFTGSDHFNRSMRHYAKARGYSLSDHGIVRAVKLNGNNVVRGTVNLVPATTEEDVFAALGLEYVEPHLRNTEVVAVSKPHPPLLEDGGSKQPRLL